ncbi:hypothetical protein CYLTODRAFT_29174 [Cylindrobasidium torrendii FP15055 ss-10]|uniref:Uncharacterized protein n=1 Tax=Cylindrobasidium torrendii FP15055 ss-10 TaxID=1314674 RepID=A0A0D7BQA4_9AGAR|nr:hypothetical protein CYLTODRAFT_29174 [Cylindrobasidium torrendii FP15055 ss-10]
MQQPFESEFLMDSIPRKRRRCNESEQPQFWRAYMRPRLSTLSSLSDALIDREAHLEQSNNASIILNRLHQKELEDLRCEMDELRTAMDELCIAMHAFRYSALRQGSPLPLGLQSDQIEAFYQSSLAQFSSNHPLRPTVEALCVPTASTSTHVTRIFLDIPGWNAHHP